MTTLNNDDTGLNNDDAGEFFLGIPSRHAIRTEYLRSIKQGKTIYGNGRYAQDGTRINQKARHAESFHEHTLVGTNVTVVGAEITSSKLSIEEDDPRECTGYNPYNNDVQSSVSLKSPLVRMTYHLGRRR